MTVIIIILKKIHVQFKKKKKGKRKELWDFPGGPVFKTLLPTQGVWVRSLARELRSHMARKKKLFGIPLKYFTRLKDK